MIYVSQSVRGANVRVKETNKQYTWEEQYMWETIVHACVYGDPGACVTIVYLCVHAGTTEDT